MFTVPPRLFLDIVIPEEPSNVEDFDYRECGGNKFYYLEALFKDIEESVDRLEIYWDSDENDWYEIWDDEKMIWMSTNTFWKYFGQFFEDPPWKMLGQEFLKNINLREYDKFDEDINELEILIESIKNSDSIAAEATKELLDIYRNQKKRFVKWFIFNGVTIPEKSSRKEKIQKVPNSTILKNIKNLIVQLEDPKYVITGDDKKLMAGDQFNSHRALHTKKYRQHFNEIVNNLIKEPLSLDDFHMIIKCPESKYYKDQLVRSIIYSCNIKSGKYFSQCLGKKIHIRERRLDENSPLTTKCLVLD
jgi:hypothetical protein